MMARAMVPAFRNRPKNDGRVAGAAIMSRARPDACGSAKDAHGASLSRKRSGGVASFLPVRWHFRVAGRFRRRNLFLGSL